MIIFVITQVAVPAIERQAKNDYDSCDCDEGQIEH